MSVISDKEHVKGVCKMGKGNFCCKYLVVGGRGFECMKADPLDKKVIDNNWARTPHVAQGDNCEGYKGV